MLRGVSIIGLPQFAQVGDLSMVSSELRPCRGCSGLSYCAVAAATTVAKQILIVSAIDQSGLQFGGSMAMCSGFPSGPHAGRALASPAGGRFFVHKAFEMTKAENYRKRAKALGKRMSYRQAQRTTPIGRKQKALTDMADNEDWLDGKTKAKG
jgi:hypothetical protein